MSFLLSADDRRAIDVVMDRGPTPASHAWERRMHGPVFDRDFQGRLQKIAGLLHVLSHMPAPEPSDNLIQRTLQHIEASRQLHPTPINLGGFAQFGG